MKIIDNSKRYYIIDVNPDDLAAQFTIIDLPIFKCIKKDEIINLGNNNSNYSNNSSNKRTYSRKQILSPNIVAMNRQFNQVTFWVVGQILSHELPRIRAELISQFIKTAKQLYLLNNLHSSYAVLSALLSSPIYRLEKTWNFIRKKYPRDLQQFEYLKNLFSDNNNYELLRNHLTNCNLPCIPYLGVYSRDIIYINEAHPEGTVQRTKNTSKILESIEKFQLSEYNDLVHLPNITSCLLSSRYIDELQKFVEDENYRKSLELESPDVNHHNANKKSSMILASLTSMVQSASNKFGGSSPRRSSGDSQKSFKYLIDDSFIDFPTLDCSVS